MAKSFATIGILKEDKDWITERSLNSNPNKKAYEIVTEIVEHFKKPVEPAQAQIQNFDLAKSSASMEQKISFLHDLKTDVDKQTLYEILLTDTEVIFCPSEETLTNLKKSLKTVAPEFITGKDKDASEKWSDLVNMSLNYMLTHPNEVNQWRLSKKTPGQEKN